MSPLSTIFFTLITAFCAMFFALWYVTKAVEERRKGWVSPDDKEPKK